MKAEITPTASAIPNVSNGGKGDMMFAKNAATVVMTASPNGVESRAHEASHDSAESSNSARKALYLLCKWIE